MAGCNCAAQFTSSFQQDAFGRVILSTDPLGHQTATHHDVDGNRNWSQDGSQVGTALKTIFVYDKADELTVTSPTS